MDHDQTRAWQRGGPRQGIARRPHAAAAGEAACQTRPKKMAGHGGARTNWLAAADMLAMA